MILKAPLGWRSRCQSPRWQTCSEAANPLNQTAFNLEWLQNRKQICSWASKRLYFPNKLIPTAKTTTSFLVSQRRERKKREGGDQNNATTYARRPSLFSASLLRETCAADGLLRDRRPRDSRYQRGVHVGSAASLSVESRWQHASGDQRAPLLLPHEWLMFSVFSVF